jgi:hypothetical protein
MKQRRVTERNVELIMQDSDNEYPGNEGDRMCRDRAIGGRRIRIVYQDQENSTEILNAIDLDAE